MKHHTCYKSCHKRPRPQVSQLSPPTRLLLATPVSALGSMALWMTLVIALTCFGGLASPGPVPTFTALRELIEELDNITQKVSACWPGPQL